MKKFLLLFLLSVSAFAQQGIFPSTGGGGAPSGPAAGVLSGTYPNPGVAALIPVLQKVQYLSSASEIGAQCNTAVTALGATGGVIQLPNSTSLTMTTTCTNIPPGISIRGYGKLATFITCSVVGDCFQFLQNPTTAGEIASEINSFGIKGSNTGQTLFHCNGCSGYTFRDLQFQPYPGVAGDTAAVCLEFDNNGTGQFTEGNWVDVSLERTCTIGALLNKGTGTNSFAYNHFRFHVVSQLSNFAVVLNGAGELYGGDLTIFGNHVSNNTGGGILQINNGFTTGSGTFPGEILSIAAEEDGTGSGSVISATGSGTLGFGPCSLINGAGGAPSLATLIGGSNSANVYGCTGSTVTGGANLGSGASGNGAIGLNVQGDPTQSYGGIQIDTTGQTGGKKFQFEFFAGNMFFFDVTANTHIAELVGATTPFNNQLKVGSASIFAWSSAAQFISAAPDTGLSRDAADAVDCGNGTQGDKTCTLNVGKINVLAARKGTFVCTAGGTIPITNANETATSDVVISLNTAGGTITTSPAMKTVTAATGFTVLCGATDTSTYNYDILN